MIKTDQEAEKLNILHALIASAFYKMSGRKIPTNNRYKYIVQKDQLISLEYVYHGILQNHGILQSWYITIMVYYNHGILQSCVPKKNEITSNSKWTKGFGVGKKTSVLSSEIIIIIIEFCEKLTSTL